MFRITIFAARRVLPPLLITPANASKPFMKLTGPDAIPPPESVSLLPRSEEKLVPVPEPHLKSIPSVFAKSMIEPMSSRTELIKQAEHWGLGCTPTLNHTGELNAIFCSTSKCVSSSRNASRAAVSAKYPPSSPQRTMVFTTRPINCRTEPSRPAVPDFPLKYLLATMFVAVCDQLLGTSTSSWWKMVMPFSFAIRAVRFSHSTMSKGDFSPSVKYRRKTRPFPRPLAVFSAAVPVAGNFPLNACFTVAICPSRFRGSPPKRGEPYYFTPLRSAEGAALGPKVGAEIRATRFLGLVKASREKKPTARQSHSKLSANHPCTATGRCSRTQPNSRCPATTTGAEQVLRARFFFA